MTKIPLTQNMFALIDDEDLELVQKYKWYAHSNPSTTYASSRTGSKYIDMHRLIMKAKKGQRIDHRNCRGLDNRKHNLRFATIAQNGQNRRANKNGSSMFKGVYRNRELQRWISHIRCNDKWYHCGCFENEQDAAIAYDLKAIELFGEFARLNILENP